MPLQVDNTATLTRHVGEYFLIMSFEGTERYGSWKIFHLGLIFPQKKATFSISYLSIEKNEHCIIINTELASKWV